MNVGHAGFDILPELKLVTAFGQFNGTKLACPVINVLKQVTMDMPQMGEVELSGRNALAGALYDQLSLGVIETLAIGDVQLVSEDGRSRIDVRIIRYSAAAA